MCANPAFLRLYHHKMVQFPLSPVKILVKANSFLVIIFVSVKSVYFFPLPKIYLKSYQ